MSTKPLADDEVIETTEETQEVQPVDHADCEAQIASLTEQVATWEGKYRRALADYANLERQTAESTTRFAKLATRAFVEDLIEPYEHLLLALKATKDVGLKMILESFRKVFESQGLKEINPQGQPFDATTMEVVDTKEGKADEVIEVLSTGFELNGVVIKHARVIVGK